MDEIKRLTPAQRARCNRLIRRLCANYDGGAASNIKRRESLDFRGFFEGEAGAGQLFDLGIPKILGEPRPAPDALSRFATQLCQLAAGQRRASQAHLGVAGTQRLYHHGEHLRPLGLQVQDHLGAGDGDRACSTGGWRLRKSLEGGLSRKSGDKNKSLL